MENILSKSCAHVLEQFVWSRLAIAMDFDGTLAPIVSSPAAARVPASTAALARRLSTLFPCAIVSGRSPQDLVPRLSNLGSWSRWSGGAELSADALARVREWRSNLERAVRRFPGVEVEDKQSRLTVHYRRCRKKREVVRCVRTACTEFVGARILEGKQVIHIQPSEVPDKGAAVDEILGKLECDTVLYVGDDETDEDVFARDEPHRLLTVRVGQSDASQARYYLPDQRDLNVLLARLVSLRESMGQRADGVGSSVSRSTESRDALLGALRGLDRTREIHSRAIEDALGVTAQQQAIIRTVGQYPGIAPGQVAELLHVDPSAVTALLKFLVRRGLVTRSVDPVNKRRHRLGLSTRGRRLDEPISGSVESAVAKAVSRCDLADLQATQRVLDAVAKGFAG